jgi:hypothetical protein
MLLGQEVNEGDTLPQLEEFTTDIESPAEDTMVLMYATHSNPHINTMQFKGQVGLKPVYALLNSDSTHSFVDPSVLPSKSHQSPYCHGC